MGKKAFLFYSREALARPNSRVVLQSMYTYMAEAIRCYVVSSMANTFKSNTFLSTGSFVYDLLRRIVK